MTLVAFIERRILASLRTRFCRAADAIDREYPGPYTPGTIGAEWATLAVKLRDLIPPR